MCLFANAQQSLSSSRMMCAAKQDLGCASARVLLRCPCRVYVSHRQGLYCAQVRRQPQRIGRAVSASASRKERKLEAQQVRTARWRSDAV